MVRGRATFIASFFMPAVPFLNELLSLGTSLLCGAAIGMEREYHNKSTGLRTILLISLGSTLFTMMSHYGAGSDDRISANIITGIGFIGAGVIFKDRVAVLGLTTAAVIWVTAAIGMAAGAGAHGLAFSGAAIVLLVLIALHPAERWINTLPQTKTMTFIFAEGHHEAGLITVGTVMRAHELHTSIIHYSKKDHCSEVVIKVTGRPKAMQQAREALLSKVELKEFY